MILSIHLIPNARANEIVGFEEGALRVRIAAPPIEGKANEELIRFLAKALDLAPSEIALKSGQGSRHKRIDLPLTLAEIKTALHA
jgi:hypothetical protein